MAKKIAPHVGFEWYYAEFIYYRQSWAEARDQKKRGGKVEESNSLLICFSQSFTYCVSKDFIDLLYLQFTTTMIKNSFVL